MASTFSDKEKAMIKALHDTHSAEHIGRILRRTPKAVRRCERQLGFPKRTGVHTALSLANAARKRSATVTREKLLRDGIDKPTTTHIEAYGDKTYDSMNMPSSNHPLVGARVSRAAIQGSTGSAAQMCCEG